MGTRGCIARQTGAGTFVGTYHHWDSYPFGLGANLWHAYKSHFQGDLPRMLRFLIDEHPAGWSTIACDDWTAAPGFEEAGFTTKGPHCYCHGGRHEEGGDPLTEQTASSCGCEYAYVFDEIAQTMQILSSYRPDGKKMIGFFGQGHPDANWHILATVDLTQAAEPNWLQLESNEE